MSRIRSVHPSLWTDDEFVSLSFAARLFLIGLWTEADDFGLFEWKPLRLKMRLAPADAIDASAIMDELAEFGFLKRITRDGKEYGAVKNFRKYQRPQKPGNPLVAIDDEIRNVIHLRQTVPLEDSSSTDKEPLQDHSDSGSVNPPQMEDGKGRRKGNSSPAVPRDAGTQTEAERALEGECRAIAADLPAAHAENFIPVLKLLDEGLLPDDILTAMRAIREKNHPLRNWHGVVNWARTAAKDRIERAMPPANYDRAGPDAKPSFVRNQTSRGQPNGTPKNPVDVIREIQQRRAEQAERGNKELLT